VAKSGAKYTMQNKKNGAHQQDVAICLIVLIICLLTIFSYRDYVKAVFLPVSSYSHTVGTVIVSQLREVEARGYAKPVYYVVYEYEVNGRQYTSDKIDFKFIQTDGTESGEEAVLATYPVDKHVVVYYQRSHPEFAVLQPDVPIPTKIFIICLFFFFLLSAYGMVWFYYSSPDLRRN